MQVGNDETAHNASNPNARKTGDPQANAFRQAGFEQELCRVVASGEVHPAGSRVLLPRRELRCHLRFTFALTAAGAIRNSDWAGSTAALLWEAVGGSGGFP